MPNRYNFASINLSGTKSYVKCDGTKVAEKLQSSSRLTGSAKAAVKLGDGSNALPYWAFWVSQHKEATAAWQTKDVGTCNRIIGNTGYPWYNPTYRSESIIAKVTFPVPTQYFPLFYITTGYRPLTNGEAIFNGRATALKREITNAHLNKIKGQAAMSLVSLAETGKTVKLARDLFDDVSTALVTIAKGVTNPKSLVDKYLKYAQKNGLRAPWKTKRAGMSATERRFITNMQSYYKKHKIQHNRLLQGIPKDAASRWLQYRYGIGPAIGDLAAAHDYVYTRWQDFVHHNDIVVKYRVKREGLSAAAYTNNDYFGTVNVTTKAVAQMISRFYISNHVAHVARKTGFSPAELAATIWELTPWSFIVDWFYDLGGYLSAASATAGLTHRWTSFSIKEEVVDGVLDIIGSAQGAIQRPSASEKGKVKYGGFVREVYYNSGFPFPVPPKLEMPFKSLVSKRSFDSLALLFGKRDFSKLTNRGA